MKKTENSEFWHNKKVLVTGGSGFIGSHLCELLLENGANVRVTYQNPEKLENLKTIQNSVELMQSNLFDAQQCNKACKGQEIVLNLAARVAGIEFNRQFPATMLRDNVQLELNMLEAARAQNVERFLVVSSACVYPNSSRIPTPEEDGFLDEPEPTNSGYGWAKRFAELLGQKYSQEHGMQIAIARPYNSYGPRDNFDPKTSHVIPALIHRIEAGENPLVVWGNGTPTRAFCYVTDFARGLMLCAEKGIGKGAINIGSSEEVSIKQLVELIIEASEKDIETRFDTSKPNGQARRCSDQSKAEKELGFYPQVSLKQGLEKTVEWYRTQEKKPAN